MVAPLSTWLRVIRIRFLLASIIAVMVALALGLRHSGTIDVFDALLTLGGVIALHASVDLLNDYWDYKRGIDTATKRTKFSGGTGVLPEGLLRPSSVYKAGIAFLIIGAAAGAYFVMMHGVVIAAILGFAILSIYFYSTKIVDTGLGEAFVAIKGCMIVLGAFYIQYGDVTLGAALAGITVGSLSSLVLFAASFPDYAADKAKGRKTLVILLGPAKAARVFWTFPLVSYVIIVCGVITGLLPVAVLVMFAASPIAVRAGIGLARNCTVDAQRMVPSLSQVVLYGRVAGGLLAASLFVSALCVEWWWCM